MWLHLAGPWETDLKARTAAVFNDTTIAVVQWPLGTAAALFAAFLVWNNYRRGRIDRTGAVRIGAFVFLLEASSYFLYAAHSFDFRSEVGVLRQLASRALLWSAIFVFLYIGLEPWVRRRWPELLIGWSRLLAGNWRDPMVGRDVLLGIAGGVAHGLLAFSSSVVPAWLGLRPELFPRVGFLNAFTGIRFGLSYIPSVISTGIAYGLVELVMLVGFVALMRRRNLAILALWILHTVAMSFVIHFDAPGVFFFAIISAMIVLLVARVGILAIAAFQLGFAASFSLPQPVDPTSWTFAPSLVGVLCIAVVTFWAFRTALAGQPAFSGFDD